MDPKTAGELLSCDEETEERHALEATRALAQLPVEPYEDDDLELSLS